jgi:hypothetical protein
MSGEHESRAVLGGIRGYTAYANLLLLKVAIPTSKKSDASCVSPLDAYGVSLAKLTPVRISTSIYSNTALHESACLIS